MNSHIETIKSTLEKICLELDLDASLVDFDGIGFCEEPEKAWSVCARLCGDLNVKNPKWSTVGGRILLAWLKIQNPYTFSQFVEMGAGPKGFQKDYVEYVKENAKKLDELEALSEVDLEYVGVCTLIQSYLYRTKGENEKFILETPVQLYMRVATFLWLPDYERIEELYFVLQSKKASMPSPVYFNAATRRPACFSCFLIHVPDSMEGITDSWKEIATISMNKGGIGVDFSSLRHSEIGNSGKGSRGIVPWAKVQNEVIGAVDQGALRKGSSTNFLRDFHVDFEEFCELRKTTGAESMRARELFLGVMISDLFMKRLKADKMWSFFDPNTCPGLTETFGQEFEDLYIRYEKEGKAIRQTKAMQLYINLYQLRVETGMPFVAFIDNINRKNMQSNIGIVRQSNLCMEIVQHTSEKELASCVLGSIGLPAHIKMGSFGTPEFDFDALDKTVRIMVRTLNQMIDRSYYPDQIPKIRETNMKNRPLGLGEQGLADLFAILDLCWEDEKARKLHYQIEERQYYAAISESIELAAKFGPYDAWVESPYSEGFLHPDLCAKEGKFKDHPEWSLVSPSKKEKIRQDAAVIGTRNSLVRARMPTATTAHIIGNNESFEPFSHLIFTRNLMSGAFVMVNKYLYQDIQKWCPEAWTSENIERIKLDGSIKNFSVEGKPEVEQKLKNKYKNAFEIPSSTIIKFNTDTLAFVDQTSSQNVHMNDPSFHRILTWDFTAWEAGMKTSTYYIRRPPVVKARNFVSRSNKSATSVSAGVVCNEDVCTSCQV